MFRKPRPTRSAAATTMAKTDDPRRIWIEELLGSTLPRRADRREAAIAALLKDGGLGTWNRLRAAI